MAKKVVRKKQAEKGTRPAKREGAPARRRPSRGGGGETDSGSNNAEIASWAIRAVVVIALAIAAWMIVPPYLQAQKAKPLWEQAVAAATAGDFDQAISLINEAKEAAPDWAELQRKYPSEIAMYYIQKGVKHAQSRDDKSAVAAFEKSFEHDPKAGLEHGVYYAAAESYNRLGKLQKALEMAKKEIDMEGSEAKAAEQLVKFLIKKMADGDESGS